MLSNNIKSLIKTSSLTVRAYSNEYLEYKFLLEYGAPAYLKFVDGFQTDTVLPSYAVNAHSLNDSIIYTIYYIFIFF